MCEFHASARRTDSPLGSTGCAFTDAGGQRLPPMIESGEGRIVTFYSYKGGTGRSMALANVGCLLAQRQAQSKGKGVLVIDWDLEAPGLHRFFQDRFHRAFSGNANYEKRLQLH